MILKISKFILKVHEYLLEGVTNVHVGEIYEEIENKPFFKKFSNSIAYIIATWITQLVITIIFILLAILFPLSSISNLIVNYYDKLEEQEKEKIEAERNRMKNEAIHKSMKEYEKLLINRYDEFYKLKQGDEDIDIDFNRHHDLSDFIIAFLNRYNRLYSTYYKNNHQCGPNRRRSLGDIFLICKTYFPNCTLEQVFCILASLIYHRKIGGCYCTTINKYVFYPTDVSSAVSLDSQVEYIIEGYPNIRFKDICIAYGFPDKLKSIYYYH